MTYVDLNTIHNPATGTVAPAAWGDQVRDNLEFLIDPPACSVYNSAAVSLANGAATVLGADSENYDNDSMHSTVTNTSRVTAQTAGRYLVIASVRFDANATGNRQIDFYINGVLLTGGVILGNAGSTNSTVLNLSKAAVLAAGDYVEVSATQRSGGALNATLVEFLAYLMTR